MSPYSVLPTLYGDTHCTANWRNVAVAIQCMSLISVYTLSRYWGESEIPQEEEALYDVEEEKQCGNLKEEEEHESEP